MDWTTGLTIAVTVLLAFAGYLATYAYNLRLAQRKDRLERVNKQLSNLYGPLYALVSSSQACWKAFRTRYRPGVPFWSTEPPPTDEEAAAWRLWIVEVFMPINVAMADVITQNADLLDEPEVPPVLLDICAHVKGYQPIIKRWEAGDFSENSSVINFPRGRIEEFAFKEFSRLKKEQSALLGHDT